MTLVYLIIGGVLAPVVVYAAVRLGTAAYFKSRNQFTPPTKETP